MKSQANLRSLAQVHELYSGQYRGSLINPFDIERFLNGSSYSNEGWGVVRKVGTNVHTVFGAGSGNTKAWYSEMYAFHWYSVIGGWISPGDYASEVQFAPADRTIIVRNQRLQEDPPFPNWSLETGFWDGSYILSPTAWFAPERYRDDGRPDAPKNNPGKSMVKRNRFSHITYPSQKVLMWERFDWTKSRRTASYRNLNFNNGEAHIFGQENLPPQWNNY